MVTTAYIKRIDILLALALASERGARGGDGPPPAIEPALSILSGLGQPDRQAVESRARWYEGLAESERAGWLATTLAQAAGSSRKTGTGIDPSVHPSQIIEALSREPPRVQELILNRLPRDMVRLVSAGIGRMTQPRPEAARRRAEGAAVAVRQGPNGSSREPDGESVGVVCRAFFSQFVSIDMLHEPADLDLLSAVELARLVRLLGGRQTAVACRGIAAVEAVASFLRHFTAEDARAIAAHITALTAVDPAQVEFAEKMVHTALRAEMAPSAMLDWVGMRLLAITLSGRETVQIRYTTQKLPVEAARALEDLIASSRETCDESMAKLIRAEAEELARTLRTSARPEKRSDCSTDSVAERRSEAI
jgi:hypothetical protein